MSTFRCRPIPGGHTPPAYSGTSVGSLRDDQWTVTDDGSPDGDILRIDIIDFPAPEPGYKVQYFEIAISDNNGSTTVERVYGGPAKLWARRKQTDTPLNRQRVQIRTVQMLLNQLFVQPSPVPYTPLPGDAVVQPTTGATATVVNRYGAVSGANHLISITDISGTFEKDVGITIAGVTANNLGPMHVTHEPGDQVPLRSEWSLPKDVTPAVGSPSVTVTASKTVVLQGEAVVIEATAEGFQCTRPLHDLHWYMHCDVAGEQGDLDALPTEFETCFGPGSRQRAEAYTSVWAFCPKTVGTVRVFCDVRDADGNTAQGFVDLDVRDPLTEFAAGDIYAASSTSESTVLPVGANVYTDLATLLSNLPTSGEALVLLDTADVHSPGDYTEAFSGAAPDRLAIMAYSASGVGPNAGGRAEMHRAVSSSPTNGFSMYGIEVVGPFDSRDPWSISGDSLPPDGMNLDEAPHASIASCIIRGYARNVMLPAPGNTAAYFDVQNYDFQDFGFNNGDVGKHALHGVRCYHRPESWRYPGRQEENGVSPNNPSNVGWFTDHGPYRCSRPVSSRGFSKNFIFSCCSWGGTGGPQPPYRFFGDSSEGDRPEVLHGAQNLTEGGGLGFGSTTRGGGETTAHPQNAMWDKFFHITSMQSGTINLGLGGVTIQNGVLATSGLPWEVNGQGINANISSTNLTQALPGQNDSEYNPDVVRFITVVDLRDETTQGTGTSVLWSNASDYPLYNVSIENVVHYAPNFTPGEQADAPLDRAFRWTPMYAGQYWWQDQDEITGTNQERIDGQTPDTQWATPPVVTASFEPASGSAAYQSATGFVPYEDIMGNVRPAGTATKGAREPTSTHIIDSLPTFDQRAYVVGDTVTYTLGSSPGNTMEIGTFTLASVDRSGDASGGTFVTDATGELVLESKVVGQSKVSGQITAQVVDVRPAVDTIDASGTITQALNGDWHQQIFLTATNADPGDKVFLLATPEANTPTADQVRQRRLGSDNPDGQGIGKWGGVFFMQWKDKLNGNYRVHAVIDNGVTSTVLSSSVIAVNTN